MAERSLRFNVLLNLAGQVVPFAAAVVVMPALVHALGSERLGVLMIAWVLIGYFGLFDLGIGRALTRQISVALAKDRHAEAPHVALTGLALMAGLGLFAASAMAGIAPWLAGSALKVPPTLQPEVEQAFYVLAAGIPFTILTSGMTAVLEAHQRFLAINLIKIPMGLFLFLGPLIAVSYSPSLVGVVFSLILCRFAAFIAFVAVCKPFVAARPQTRDSFAVHSRALLSFGGWLTVSNVIGPLMLYADRFFIAGIVSLAAVAYYTVPFEVVSKVLIIPSAMLGVMFPAFTRAQAQGRQQARSLYLKTQYYIALAICPLVAGVVLFAADALRLWIDHDYAQNSALVAQVLIVGVLMNSFGLVSQAFVQARGRPDLTAKLHLCEAPLYFLYLIYFLGRFGIVGAAAAWLLRTSLSAFVLAYMANKALSSDKET